jgi:hypothetical protein
MRRGGLIGGHIRRSSLRVPIFLSESRLMSVYSTPPIVERKIFLEKDTVSQDFGLGRISAQA